MLSELQILYNKRRLCELMDNVKPNLIGFDNGVYDLEKNDFREAKADEYISVTTGYAYQKADPKKKKEAFKILQQILPDEDELRCVLKQASLGLYGGNPEEKFYIWIGTGGNGKGVLRDILQVVLGGYYDSMDIVYLYKTNVIKAESANPIMARKKNSRLVITTEPMVDQQLKSSVIKTLSGNDPVQVRALYGNSFNYIPKFKLIIQTNNEPIFEGFDGGMKRRINLIRFPNKFVDNPILDNERKKDITLKKRIVNDKNYNNEFFEILVEHYQMYLKEGLILSKRFERDTQAFIKSNDPVGEWMEARIQKTKLMSDMIKSRDLYNDYMTFSDGDKGITQQLFKNMLECEGIKQHRMNSGIYYTNVKIKN